MKSSGMKCIQQIDVGPMLDQYFDNRKTPAVFDRKMKGSLSWSAEQIPQRIASYLIVFAFSIWIGPLLKQQLY